MSNRSHDDPPTHAADQPRLAVRRHTDRCFFRVEEVVEDGYIVDGILFACDDIAAVVQLDEHGFPIREDRQDKRPGPSASQ